jgi:CheY-like chemotaxis protein
MSVESAKTVLCIDDNESVLRMLATILGSVGYRVLTVTTGREGMEIAVHQFVNAVVLDYEMPDLSGAEVAALLKQARPTLPIVMFSAHAPQVLGEAVRYIDAFVEKAEAGTLLAELARVLRPVEVTSKRRFPRYPVQAPVAVNVTKPSGITTVQGIAVDVAEGGMGGLLEGDVEPGDVVSVNLQIPECPLRGLRAQVRYRNGASYGFEFIDLTAPQQFDVKRCLQKLSEG